MGSFVFDTGNELSESVSSQLCQQLNQRGWSVLEATQPDPDASLLGLRTLFGQVVHHPYSREQGVVVVDNAYRPPRAMSPHTDGTYYPKPPGIVCLQCVVAASSGGASTLVDGAAIYDFVLREFPLELSRLFEPVFGVRREDRYVESPLFWRQNARVGIRLRIDETIELRVPRELQQVLDGIRRFIEDPSQQTTLTLKARQILVTDNTRVLHGRTAYDGSEQRKMYRMHFDGCGTLPLELGFTPGDRSAAG